MLAASLRLSDMIFFPAFGALVFGLAFYLTIAFWVGHVTKLGLVVVLL